jgi:hypothetical protein
MTSLRFSIALSLSGAFAGLLFLPLEKKAFLAKESFAELTKAPHIVILKERRISARTEESRFIKRCDGAKKKSVILRCRSG